MLKSGDNNQDYFVRHGCSDTGAGQDGRFKEKRANVQLENSMCDKFVREQAILVQRNLAPIQASPAAASSKARAHTRYCRATNGQHVSAVWLTSFK